MSLHCHHDPKDKPNHLCPYAALQPKLGQGQDQAFVENYHCGVCKTNIKLLTPVDSDRQYLTEAELLRRNVRVV